MIYKKIFRDVFNTLYDFYYVYNISRKYILNVDDQIPNSYKVQSWDFHFFHYTQKNLDHLLNNLFQHKKLHDVPCVWLIYFDFTMTIQQVIMMLSNASLGFDDDFIVALNQNDGQVLLWELYKIGSMKPISDGSGPKKSSPGR